MSEIVIRFKQQPDAKVTLDSFTAKNSAAGPAIADTVCEIICAGCYRNSSHNPEIDINKHPCTAAGCVGTKDGALFQTNGKLVYSSDSSPCPAINQSVSVDKHLVSR
jgi:hypothetical protein